MKAEPGVDAEHLRPVLPGWRGLVWLFLALTLLSTVELYVLAEQTDRYFAWSIAPPLSAAFLGAGYAAGFVLVVLTMRERVWAAARIAWATVAVFVWLTLAATLAHVDRLHFSEPGLPARFSAWLWLVVYVTVPPAMTVLLAAQRRAGGSDPQVTRPIPRPLSALLGLQGAVLVGTGGGLMVAPVRFPAGWPWTLTPLTGRAIGAWCVALGFAAVYAVAERDLGRLRAAAVTYLSFGVLQAGALLRFAHDVEWRGPAAWVYVAVLAAITFTGAWGYLAARKPAVPRPVGGPRVRRLPA